MSIEVLDKGFVRVTDHMGTDLTVVNAARVSYGKESKEFRDRDERLLKYLWDNKHTSPFRHASVQFHIKAPLFVIRQWMKHQVGCAWNEISGRYVEFDVEYYFPSNWREQHEQNKQGSTGSIKDQPRADSVYQQGCVDAIANYYELLAAGVCKEQARMVLPLSLYTECYWTASLQAILHFLELREDEHSQWEIRQYAAAVRRSIEDLFPVSLSLRK